VREKLLARAADRFLVLIDPSKFSVFLLFKVLVLWILQR
jgi:ribose 5-phosphate isomerase